MTNQAESDILTQVGPGTPMGGLMREYWLPALKASELKADGDPVRLMLLGEKLIGFRDTSGRVGIMDHRCPHRCASFFFGRNEEDGIRCVYHGWKFDVDGNCLDMANVPPAQDFKHKVKAKAYKAEERNGLIWVYMGAAAKAPPLPAIEATLLPESEINITFAQRECNWLQALEGDIDTSHFSFLHAGSVKMDDLPEGTLGRFQLLNKAPEFHAEDTPWGTMYAAFRPADAGETYWRMAHFLFPCWTMQPNGDMDHQIHARAWVPLDDTHTMFVQINWTGMKRGMSVTKTGAPLPGGGQVFDYLPTSTDWLGRYRLNSNAGNDYLIDRDAQRRDEIYTGITGIYEQDQAITESMGAITDHTFERLAPSDAMVTNTRRRLLNAVKAMKDNATPPPGADDPGICLGARSGHFVAGNEKNWHEAYAEQLSASANPTGQLRQAAE
ncbi:MAG: Rieske 2Fe-2S domain-containing protein [Rhodospirillales bacterium]|nr:Rieske 2Fe-2S domain-containing protein [Rhodospirillales bacterium]